MAEPIRIHRLSFYLYSGIRGRVGTHALITYTKTPEILGSLVWLLNFRKAKHILICNMLYLCNNFHIISKWDRSSTWEHVSSHVGSRKVNIPKQNIVNFDTGTLEMSQEILALLQDMCTVCMCMISFHLTKHNFGLHYWFFYTLHKNRSQCCFFNGLKICLALFCFIDIYWIHTKKEIIHKKTLGSVKCISCIFAKAALIWSKTQFCNLFITTIFNFNIFYNCIIFYYEFSSTIIPDFSVTWSFRNQIIC